jgi:transposase-like protein
MDCSTKWEKRYFQWGSVVHTAAVAMVVVLLITGHRVESLGGWQACPARVVRLEGSQRSKEPVKGRGWGSGVAWRAGWAWMKRSWVVVAVRSEAMLWLVWLTGHGAWQGLSLLPWVIWGWKGLGVAWPRLAQQAWYQELGWLGEEASRLALLSLGVVWLGQQLSELGWGQGRVSGLLVGVVSVPQPMSEPSVKVTRDEEEVYHVRFKGEFELHIDGQVAFYERMLVIFLGQLEVPGGTRGSRRTRDERTPYVRQEQLAAWTGVPQPNISRWFSYWLEQDWRRMLSQKWGEVLTLEVQQRVIESWVKFPWWSAKQMWQHLQAQGSAITLRQVQQVGRESGWSVLRKDLSRLYAISAESFRPRNEWLVEQLLTQVEGLVEQLEALGGLTPEVQIEWADLKALSKELGLHSFSARRALPWMLRLERQLFGHWERVEDETVHCLYCGTTNVSRKSRKPRLKKYVDETGELRTVEVYRYYCHNPHCPYQSFTNLPPNLLPHSPWSMEYRVAALQLYEWSHSVYRCTAQWLGVSKMTAYRWVSGFGYQLLPVAALFGVVRSSGVVGIDEKYVLVPKNDKPQSKMKRWMYVYLAVDCYTYDLLHIEIYPYNNSQSAKAFLLALRAKGYHPRVVVTDMRVDYGPLVAQVFSRAVHHECIFHALQQVREHIKEVYGADYADTHPEVETLKKEIDHIFDARTKRTARRRYEAVLAQREHFVTQRPEVTVLFDFLERHWPKLVNAIESRHIPTTNNATEQVIRIFTQHYKTFCGFESIESAQLYLAVFEKIYRFTPFSDDAQKRIRGKCPLELAGYEMRKSPIAQLFRGLALQWPASAFQELVPNV